MYFHAVCVQSLPMADTRTHSQGSLRLHQVMQPNLARPLSSSKFRMFGVCQLYSCLFVANCTKKNSSVVLYITATGIISCLSSMSRWACISLKILKVTSKKKTEQNAEMIVCRNVRPI